MYRKKFQPYHVIKTFVQEKFSGLNINTSMLIADTREICNFPSRLRLSAQKKSMLCGKPSWVSSKELVYKKSHHSSLFYRLFFILYWNFQCVLPDPGCILLLGWPFYLPCWDLPFNLVLPSFWPRFLNSDTFLKQREEIYISNTSWYIYIYFCLG